MRKHFSMPDGGSLEMPGNTPDGFRIGRPNLIVYEDAEYYISNGLWLRADGDCLCEGCGLAYKRHPNIAGHEWATLLCDLTIVKL